MRIRSLSSFREERGFTLIEIIVVVVIIAILASLAIPSYVNMREKAVDKEAIAGLKLIRAANLQYFVQSESYFPPSGTAAVTDINGNLSIALSATNWVYSIAFLSGGGFNATAVRKSRTWSVTNNTADPACTGTCL
jgi:type IV pilus assembly protein PilE